MINFSKRAFAPNAIYYIMSEQPNSCPKCATRLDVMENVMIENEIVQINYCERCNQEILMVEDEVASWTL
jgi:glutaredoxin-related protein